MKKNIAVLALALTLVGTLASCSNRDPNTNNTNGSAGNQTGANSGSAGSGAVGAGGASGAAGTVSRRYGGESTYNSGKYFDDGRYTAGSDGRVYNGGAGSHDLTQDARNIVRDAGDAISGAGRDIGDMVTGNDNGTIRSNGTPSWEPDSSAVRF